MRPKRLDERDQCTDAIARAMIEQERREREERTAALRAMRLAQAGKSPPVFVASGREPGNGHR